MIRLEITEKDQRARVFDGEKFLGVATREQRGRGVERKRCWVIILNGTLFEGPNLETLQNVLEDKFGYPRTSFRQQVYANRSANRKGEKRGAYHGRKMA